MTANGEWNGPVGMILHLLDLGGLLFLTDWIQDVFSGSKCGDSSYVPCKEAQEHQQGTAG